MNKIAIIGSGGAGKSTMSIQLGKLLDLPVFHLDRLYWHAGWVETPKEEWAGIQHDICNQERWIIDGNYRSTVDIRLAACDTVIFLDVNRYTCIYRALKRILSRKPRPDMAEGCDERFDWAFMRFLWKYPTETRPVIMQKLMALKDEKRVLIVRSGEEAIRLCLNALSLEAASS